VSALAPNYGTVCTMSLPIRPGMTVPLPGPLHSHRDKLGELADLGYTDIWSAESDGADAFTPLAMAAAWEPRLRLGTAIVPAFTRSPACFAQSVASLADAAPGRFAIGIGSSSNVIVERWNGVPFVEPYKKVRDVVRFLRDALGGDKVSKAYDTFEVQGFRLGVHPEQRPPILVAALREGMLRLAGREADGAIINWLSPDDVTKVVGVVRAAALGADKEIVARIFVCPSENAAVVRAAGKYAIAAYLNVPVYAAFHEWLGRGAVLQPMWDAWKAGDRKAALAAIPDSLVDELIVHGSPAECRATIQSYFDRGVTTTSLAILPLDPELDHWEAVRGLAPSAT
jgi:probable F420-dependent oxidoreductase